MKHKVEGALLAPMKTIPVLLGFDEERCIGTLVVDETKLPAGAGYVFALGYLHGGPDAPVELYCVSLQSDEQYLRYLEGEGAVR